MTPSNLRFRAAAGEGIRAVAGGKRLAINSTMRFSNASGSSFQSRQTQGSFVSIGVDGALIGGFGFQVGLVSDAVGDTSFSLISMLT